MMEVITRQIVVDKLAAYLQHELTLPALVTWAETALMEGEFERNISEKFETSWQGWALRMYAPLA